MSDNFDAAARQQEISFYFFNICKMLLPAKPRFFMQSSNAGRGQHIATAKQRVPQNSKQCRLRGSRLSAYYDRTKKDRLGKVHSDGAADARFSEPFLFPDVWIGRDIVAFPHRNESLVESIELPYPRNRRKSEMEFSFATFKHNEASHVFACTSDFGWNATANHCFVSSYEHKKWRDEAD